MSASDAHDSYSRQLRMHAVTPSRATLLDVKGVSAVSTTNATVTMKLDNSKRSWNSSLATPGIYVLLLIYLRRSTPTGRVGVMIMF